jgi:flagellar biosynthetic protein FliR
VNELELWQLPWAASLAVLARVGAAVAIAPPFAHAAMPRRVRAVIAIALTVGLLSTVKAPSFNSNGALIGAIASEVLIGLALGLSISLVFAAASWAGDLISHQLGLNVADSYDPGRSGEGSGLGQACWMLAVVVFLAANGHHALLHGLRTSFDAMPIGSALQGPAVVTMLSGLMGSSLALAVQIAAPVFVATLVADVAMGLAGKTMAQLGVMSAALTVRSVVGLIAMIAGIAVTVGVLQNATVNWMQIVQSSIGNLGK